MSLVNEYLKKTQDEAPSARQEGAIPPVLTSAGPEDGSKKKTVKLTLLIVVAGVAVVIVLQFGPYLRQVFVPQAGEEPGLQVAGVNSRTIAKRPGLDKSGGDEKSAKHKTVPQAGETTSSGHQPTASAGLAPAKEPPRAAATAKPVVTAPGRVIPQTNQKVSPTEIERAAASAAGTRNSRIMETDLEQKSYSTTAPSPTGARAPLPGREESFTPDTFAPSVVSVSSTSPGDLKTPVKKSRKRAVAPPANAAKYYEIALVAQKNGNLDLAEKYYQAGLRLAPSHLKMLTNLSAVYIRQRKYVQAGQVLQKSHRLNPRNIKVLVNLGIVELRRNRYAQAKPWFKEALKINPLDETALTNLAYLAQRENNFPEMERYYKRILEISPANVEVRLAYASVLERSGRYSEALSNYANCLNLAGVKSNSRLSGQIRGRIKLLSPYGRD